MREIKNGTEGDAKTNYSLGGFPAPGARSQLDRFT